MPNPGPPCWALLHTGSSNKPHTGFLSPKTLRMWQSAHLGETLQRQCPQKKKHSVTKHHRCTANDTPLTCFKAIRECHKNQRSL
ncbi:hypothetical protein I79_008029 [Cricetulus griseus]|uniref:Uncharacterized protein n=1 Tax=Cricetulus griseus TaxID=10029 RepID=G3HBZ2_CRIGR|nr:hypothetical protein I79_008029 [Cricetulus griseus]